MYAIETRRVATMIWHLLMTEDPPPPWDELQSAIKVKFGEEFSQEMIGDAVVIIDQWLSSMRIGSDILTSSSGTS